MKLNQYQIVLADLDPTIGSEKKKRPCAIISPDEMNKYLQTLVVAPRIRQDALQENHMLILSNCPLYARPESEPRFQEKVRRFFVMGWHYIRK